MSAAAPPSVEQRRRLREEAAAWFARTRSGAFTEADHEGLQAWLAVSPERRDAYLEIMELWDQAHGFRNEPELLRMREAVLRRYPALSARGRRRWGLGAVAGIGAVAAIMAVALIPREPPAQAFRTGVGQTASIALIDGSRITLDTDTVVRARLGPRRRQITLERGRAFFKVAKDSQRPFVVEAGGRSVTATGTAFQVTAEPRRFEVLLVEGHVRVTQSGGGKANAGKSLTTDLEPGARLSSNGTLGWVLTRASGGELAWMNGELLFDNHSLGAIAAQVSRYSRRKIIIRDPALADRKVYGAFMAGDADQFVHALVDYKVARLESENDTEVVLGPP